MRVYTACYAYSVGDKHPYMHASAYEKGDFRDLSCLLKQGYVGCAMSCHFIGCIDLKWNHRAIAEEDGLMPKSPTKANTKKRCQKWYQYCGGQLRTYKVISLDCI